MTGVNCAAAVTMPPLRGFGLFYGAFYKDSAPTELAVGTSARSIAIEDQAATLASSQIQP